MRSGVRRISDERHRQIEKKGHTADHDDTLSDNSLIDAAMAYITTNTDNWPWHDEESYPTFGTRIRNLEKAGALIAAEIDRLIRLELSKYEETL